MDISIAFSEIIVYLFVGGLTGVIAGLLGVGGGIIVVPVLMWLLPSDDILDVQRMHVAVATSLMVMIPTAIVSAHKHYRQGNLSLDIFPALGGGILVGSIAGVFLADILSRHWLQTVFALFELFVAIQLLKPMSTPIRSAHSAHIGKSEMLCVGGGIGSLSSLLGIGGGTMTVPYLNWRGLEMHRAIGTSAACGVVIAIVGSVVFSIVGPGEGNASMSGYIYLPAALCIAIGSTLSAAWGAALGQRLSTLVLRRLLGVLLLFVGIRMLF